MIFGFDNLEVKIGDVFVDLTIKFGSRIGFWNPQRDEYYLMSALLGKSLPDISDELASILDEDEKYVRFGIIAEAFSLKSQPESLNEVDERINSARKIVTDHLINCIRNGDVGIQRSESIQKYQAAVSGAVHNESAVDSEKAKQILQNVTRCRVADAIEKDMSLYQSACWLLRVSYPAVYACMLCYNQRQTFLQMVRMANFSAPVYSHGRKSFIDGNNIKESYTYLRTDAHWEDGLKTVLAFLSLRGIISRENANAAMDKVAAECKLTSFTSPFPDKSSQILFSSVNSGAYV